MSLVGLETAKGQIHVCNLASHTPYPESRDVACDVGDAMRDLLDVLKDARELFLGLNDLAFDQIRSVLDW